ncbi:MAG TPA: organomercurial lyase [Ilumatobacteraceae bacterium]
MTSSALSAPADRPDAEMVEDVRLCIYHALARTGRLPDLADLLAITTSVVRLAACIDALAANRHLALGTSGEIVMAHPFATRSFGYSVMSADTLWWGGCAWDAFALPHLVDTGGDVLVATQCPACAAPLAWAVGRGVPPPGDEIAHFLVPAANIWDDVIHTCSNQLLFCSNACIDQWLTRTGNAEGYRMNLETLWRFASRWYEGRLDRGYERRHPATAHDYLRSVGLTGPFWGVS